MSKVIIDVIFPLIVPILMLCITVWVLASISDIKDMVREIRDALLKEHK